MKARWEAGVHAHSLAADVKAAGGESAYEADSRAGAATEAAPPIPALVRQAGRGGCAVPGEGLWTTVRGEAASRRREIRPI